MPLGFPLYASASFAASAVGEAREIQLGAGEIVLGRVDEAERERRLKRAQETLDRLRASDPGGDITL